MQIDNSLKNLLGDMANLPLQDIEYFIKELNVLVAQKRVSNIDMRDKFLLRKINQTVLPEPDLLRYTFLQDKMEQEALSDAEQNELLDLVLQDEKIRNKRFKYLLELSQLRQIPMLELMNQLGLNPLNSYA